MTEPEGERVADPLGAIAIAVGCVGIVVAGIVCTVLTGFLAAVAGAQAREAGRSQENAYIAFGLAVLDGVVWLVLHLMFDIPFVFG